MEVKTFNAYIIVPDETGKDYGNGLRGNPAFYSDFNPSDVDEYCSHFDGLTFEDYESYGREVAGALGVFVGGWDETGKVYFESGITWLTEGEIEETDRSAFFREALDHLRAAKKELEEWTAMLVVPTADRQALAAFDATNEAIAAAEEGSITSATGGWETPSLPVSCPGSRVSGNWSRSTRRASRNEAEGAPAKAPRIPAKEAGFMTFKPMTGKETRPNPERLRKLADYIEALPWIHETDPDNLPGGPLFDMMSWGWGGGADCGCIAHHALAVFGDPESSGAVHSPRRVRAGSTLGLHDIDVQEALFEPDWPLDRISPRRAASVLRDIARAAEQGLPASELADLIDAAWKQFGSPTFPR